MSSQSDIVTAVEHRGYREGWTDEQFAARQVAKLAEELGELSRYIRSLGKDEMGWQRYAYWERKLSEAGLSAQKAFDNWTWEGAQVLDEDKMASELADIQVVVFCLADTLGVDVIEMALDKAWDDIERGVR